MPLDDSGGSSGIFKRKELGWVNKLRLLQVSLKISRSSKFKVSDNNLNFQYPGKS